MKKLQKVKANKAICALVLALACLLIFVGCSSGGKGDSKTLKADDVSVSWDNEDKSTLNENGGELSFTVKVEDKRDSKVNTVTDIKICVELDIAYRNTDGKVSKLKKEETFDSFGDHIMHYTVDDLVNYNGRFLEGVVCTVKEVSGNY